MTPWLLGNVSSLSVNAWGDSQGLGEVGEFYLALHFCSHISTRSDLQQCGNDRHIPYI